MALDPDLVDYRQDVRLVIGQPYDMRSFHGLDPVLVQRPRQYNVLIQTGYAVGWRKIPVAAAPVFPTQLLERPDVQVTQLSDILWKRVWTYVMAVDLNYVPDHAALCQWPAAPVNFEPAPA